jgi:predicted aspartyl protease
MYLKGIGAPQNHDEALKWYRKAADQGNKYAQDELGLMYAQGVPRDYAEAARWWRKAAEQGNADAQYNLGYSYANGQGVPQDYAAAVEWFRKAAEQGNVYAQNGLGVEYELGQGVPKDVTQAVAWYRKAADQGDANGRANLARFQQLGGLPQASASLSPQSRARTTFEVALEKRNGVLVVPVLINDKIPLDFIIDSGASDVSVPADVVLPLMRTGTLTGADFTGTNTYTLADGSQVPSQTFRIRSLKVGDMVLENVAGSVASVNGELLLGQSFLSRFKSWSIDNRRQVLVLQ